MAKTKKNIKVRDLKPTKDAKGGGIGHPAPNHPGINHPGINRPGENHPGVNSTGKVG